jgi:hypothetical protein
MNPTLFATTCALAWLSTAAVVCAQSPTPGPTNPVPPNPQAHPGATIVINPTIEE